MGVLLGLAIALTGCGGSGGGLLGDVTEFVIDVIGGIFRFDSETVRLEIPKDAVDGAVTATIGAALGIPFTPLLVLGSAYDLLSDIESLKKPATMKINYDPTKVPVGSAEADLRLFKKSGEDWTEVPGSTVDPSKDQVVGKFDKFGTYAVLVSVDEMEKRLASQ